MEVTECPQCGAPAKPSQRNCEFCKAEFFITSVAYLGKLEQGAINKYLQHYKKLTRENPEDAEGHLGLGITYLELGMYPLALKSFEKVIETAPEVARAYYYCGLSRVQGRRLMTLSLPETREIERWVNTAIQLDPDSVEYKVLLALIKKDYYEANSLRVTPPSCDQIMAEIKGRKVSSLEMNRLFKCVLVRTDFVSGQLILE